MCATNPELALSAAYRKAQRLLAEWLEQRRTARRQVFAVRGALAQLNATERHSLSRWLAWLCVAATRRGESFMGRIRRLDAALCVSTEAALTHLPVMIDLRAIRHQRKSA